MRVGITRRALLRMTGGAAASAIALACGGGTSGATATPPTVAPATPSPAPAAATAAPGTPRPTPTVALLKGCTVAADDPSRPLFVDTHAHLDGITASGTDYPGAAETALGTFGAPGVRTAVVIPMPFNTTERTFDAPELSAVAERCRQRFAFGGGGGSLQPMIVAAASPSQVTADVRRRFTDAADAIVKAGGVVFGEMAAHHLSFNASHPYESVPADHALFLLLAEIAARAKIPIDLHIDAVTRDSPTPPPLRQLSPANPPTLGENVAAFERLLAHARDATIVWAHSGADQTGHSSPALYRRLMQAHANLVLQLKIGVTTTPGRSLFIQNDVLDGDRLRPEWLEIVRSFPDRIVLGGDNFHSTPGARTPFQRPQDNSSRARMLLQQLPADLAKKVASENAMRIYRLA